jgi:hypothetical protein
MNLVLVSEANSPQILSPLLTLQPHEQPSVERPADLSKGIQTLLGVQLTTPGLNSMAFSPT